MVDMACGAFAENYFMERVQAKQVKPCFGCSVAAAAAAARETKSIFFYELKKCVGGGKVPKNTLHEKMINKTRSNPNRQRGGRRAHKNKPKLSNTMKSGSGPIETNDLM